MPSQAEKSDYNKLKSKNKKEIQVPEQTKSKPRMFRINIKAEESELAPESVGPQDENNPEKTDLLTGSSEKKVLEQSSAINSINLQESNTSAGLTNPNQENESPQFQKNTTVSQNGFVKTGMSSSINHKKEHEFLTYFDNSGIDRLMTQYKVLHGDINLTLSKIACIYPILDMNRHIINTCVLVFMSDHPLLQMTILCCTNSFLLIYSLILRPFQQIKIMLICFVNETIVTLICFCTAYLCILDKNGDFEAMS